MNALGPPVQARRGADEIRPLLERGAVRELGIFEILTAGEVLVDQRRIGQWPQVFSGLQLGRGRGQKEQMDMLGHAQLDAGGFPARPIKHQHDWLAGTGSRLACELRQLDRANSASSTAKTGMLTVVGRWAR